MLKTKKEAKREVKSKALVELQRQKKMDVEEDEKLDNRELMDTEAGEQSMSENDDDLEDEAAGDDADSAASADFVNPLLGGDVEDSGESEKDGEEEQWSSDGDRYDTRVVEPKEPGSKRVVGQKRSRPDGTHLDNVKGFFKDTLEVVP